MMTHRPKRRRHSAILIWLSAIPMLHASMVWGEIVPTPTTGDAHIQSITYDPQEVVLLHVAPGFATTVVFSPGERIETVTVGDSSGWQIQVNKRADQLVVKPTGVPAGTNLTVVSDQRTYSFTLSALTPEAGVAPYLVRFSYPAPTTSDVPADSAAIPSAVYQLRGARKIRPTAISDDGHFTYIEWLPDAPMPAVYTEPEAKSLALVNGTVRDGVYVIEGVFTKLVFLRGKERAEATRQVEGPRR
jgi:type IV secretion system protein VirB9